MNFWWYIIIVIIISVFSGGSGFYGRRRSQNNRQREEKKTMSLNQLNSYFQDIKNKVVQSNQKITFIKGYNVSFNLIEYPFHISLKEIDLYLKEHENNLQIEIDNVRKQMIDIVNKIELIFKNYETKFLQEIDRILNGTPIDGDWVDIIGDAYSEYYSKFLLIAIDCLAEDIYPFLLNKLYKKSANSKKIKYSSEEEYVSSKLNGIQVIMDADFNSIFEDLVINLSNFFFKKRQYSDFDNYNDSFQEQETYFEKNTNSHPYQVLGLNSLSTNAEIKKRYRELAKKYHPDTSTDPNSKEKMLEINVAYEQIKKFRNMK